MASVALRPTPEQRLSTVSSSASFQTAPLDKSSRSSSLATIEPATVAAPTLLIKTTEHHVLPPSPPPSIHSHEPAAEPEPEPEPEPAVVVVAPADSDEQDQEQERTPEKPAPVVRSLTIADPSTALRTPVTTPVSSANGASTSGSSTSGPARPSHLSYQDGLLHPTLPTLRVPTRRNTTPAGGVSRPTKTSTSSALDPALDSDILKQAEQIRRERFQKRSKQEALDAARPSTGSLDENEPVVGHLIKEGHVNYVLMYNMLTGIRIAVSRCQAKPKRPLTEEDFTARHKFSFDIIGNELTPSAKYDFKFKDYAPWIFRDLREEYFHIDPADYLLSLTSKYILSELGSPGKSGSFFYFSRDYKYIIKTIHHSEHKFLLSVLPSYHEHVRTNPHTLISRFYGLHRVKLPRGRKIHFVIMNNLFPPHRDIHETYDLKGSTVGREYPEEKAEGNPKAVLKDLNWLHRGKVLELGKEKRALLTEQLRRDSEWLKSINVMDYSLLVGIHNMQRGNRDNLRSTNLKVFQPASIPIKRKATQIKPNPSEAIALRRAIRQSAPPQALSSSPTQLLPEPEDDGAGEGGAVDFIFYRDEGGFRATADELVADVGGGKGKDRERGNRASDEGGSAIRRRGSTDDGHRKLRSADDALGGSRHRRASSADAVGTSGSDGATGAGGGPGVREKELDTIYYLGIIDILTPYTVKKRVERLWKGLNADRHKISPVPAAEYGDRFFAFLTAIMRGGGGGDRFV